MCGHQTSWVCSIQLNWVDNYTATTTLHKKWLTAEAPPAQHAEVIPCVPASQSGAQKPGISTGLSMLFSYPCPCCTQIMLSFNQPAMLKSVFSQVSECLWRDLTDTSGDLLSVPVGSRTRREKLSMHSMGSTLEGRTASRNERVIHSPHSTSPWSFCQGCRQLHQWVSVIFLKFLMQPLFH